MYPNTAQIAAIQTYVAAMDGTWSNTDDQIVASMQADQVSNPVAQATVPATFSAPSVFASDILSTGSVAKLLTLPSFSDSVIPLLNIVSKTSQNITDLVAWAEGYALGGMILSSEATALTTLFQSTQLDPTWTSTVGWDVANLGRPADDYDIEIARGGAN